MTMAKRLFRLIAVIVLSWHVALVVVILYDGTFSGDSWALGELAAFYVSSLRGSFGVAGELVTYTQILTIFLAILFYVSASLYRFARRSK